MSLYEQPGWIPQQSEEYVSPWFRAPLPFPGHTIPKFTAAAGLRGFQFIFQYGLMGHPFYPTSNICGWLTFRRLDTRLATHAGISFSISYGFGVYTKASGEIVGWENFTREFDYVFKDEPDADYVDPEGVHHPRWKPVVEFKETVTVPSPFSGHPIYQDGKSAELAEYPWYESDPSTGDRGEKKNGGQTTLSLPVNMTYLRGKIGDWEALPSTARRRTNYWGPYGPMAATSESTEGRYCYLTASQWYVKIDLTPTIEVDDEVFEHGWSGTAKINVPHTHRHNAPAVYDSKFAGRELHNQKLAERMLQEEIAHHKWLDDLGSYDPDQASAFAIGWRPEIKSSLLASMAVLPVIHGGATKGRFFSADGKSYRVTLKIKGEVFSGGGSTIVIFRTVTVVLSLASPGEFDLRVDPDDFATILEVFKIERLDASGYVELDSDLYAAAIADRPQPGVLILAAFKARRGLRWGYPAFVEGGEYPAEETMPLGIYHSLQMRFFRKQLFRMRQRASTSRV